MFSVPQFPILTPEQSGMVDFNKAMQSAIQNYSNITQAHYLPKMQQAEIFYKQFGPLAQIASSPLAMAMLPEQKNQLLQMMSGLLQQSGGGQPQQNPFASPQTIQDLINGSQSGGGPAESTEGQPSPSATSAKPAIPAPFSTGQEQPQPPQPQPEQNQDSNYNPAFPAAGKGVGAGLTTQAVAKANEPIHPNGIPFYDDKLKKYFIQSPSGLIETSLQTYQTVKRAEPLMEEVSNLYQQLYKPGGQVGSLPATIAGALEPYDPTALLDPKHKGLVKNIADKLHISTNIVSKNADYESKQRQVGETLVRAFPSLGISDKTTELALSIIQPKLGETPIGYKQRVLSQIASLAKTAEMMKQNIFPISLGTPNNAPQAPAPMAQPPQEKGAPVFKEKSDPFKYSEGKMAPPGNKWMYPPGAKEPVPVAIQNIDYAKRTLKYKEA